MIQNRSVLLLGERHLAVQCGQALIRRGFQLQGVATSNPDIQSWASQGSIVSFDPSDDPNGLLQFIRQQGPIDYLLSVTYLRMIPREVIASVRSMAVNFHDSLLPTYAGLHATTWAIADGQHEHGISWHVIEEKADTGDLLFQIPIEVDAHETALSLNTKCFQTATESLDRLIDCMLERPVQFTKQDLSQRSYFGRNARPSVEGWIDCRQTAESLSRFVRSLDFGDRFENPLALPKLRYQGQWIIARDAAVTSTRSLDAPGTITSIIDGQIQVATTSDDLLLERLSDLDGISQQTIDAEERFFVGDQLDTIPDQTSVQIDLEARRSAQHESFWLARLGQALDYEPLDVDKQSDALNTNVSIHVDANSTSSPSQAIAAFVLFTGRMAQREKFSIGFADESCRPSDNIVASLFTDTVPFPLDVETEQTFSEFVTTISDEIELMRSHGLYLRDLPHRYPTSFGNHPQYAVQVRLVDDLEQVRPIDYPLVMWIDRVTGEHTVQCTASDAWVTHLRDWREFLGRISQNPSLPIQDITVLNPVELEKVLLQWNNTDRSFDDDGTIDRGFLQQVERNPRQIALVSNSQTSKVQEWTYEKLSREVNRIASALSERGIGDGDRVGIATSRSCAMVASVLAVMRVGAAYVPLDLEFPFHRISLMIRDADPKCILVDSLSHTRVPNTSVSVLSIDELNPSNDTLVPNSASDSIAYVMYTSGSTGDPKGVMVSHRNVMNFFTAMDDLIPHDPPGTWLAVTSLSFDISVLELLWTLTRGFKVVLHDTPSRMASTQRHLEASSAIDFGLFYFSSSAQNQNDPYRLLLEGAKFADQNGFASVWTPERHFHDFGGLYPNPSVTSAAVAAITERVKLRSGSVVLPLHHPARVAEEWSVVDQLSKGRVELSFASGWQPNDFVIQPGSYADAKETMFRNAEIVQRLWRGESVTMPGPEGKEVTFQTYPRPVQAELPVWITTAGNVDTFRRAGRIGANLLTHLLGQSITELKDRITAYRDARKEAGHDGDGQVAVMVHTFVGDDTEAVRELVRDPLTDYLRTSTSLIKGFSKTWAAFKRRSDGTVLSDFDLDSISKQEMDDLLAFSFERYFETSGLFGTPERCLDLVRQLSDAGATEISCLIDFGVETQTTLDHLPHLKRLHDLVAEQANSVSSPAAATLADLVAEHQVTHFQCTPSMAQMAMEDEADRDAIGSIPNVLLGGEALPAPLAEQITDNFSVRLLNVYGPTETTVWSTAKVMTPGEANSGSIGKPIANTFVYVLDAHKRPVAPGVAGRLWIGGEGVTRGYLGKPDLTAEKFVLNPFVDSSGNRAWMYDTGDIVRWTQEGELEFLGRADSQIKIRGHRIELSEIETVIAKHPSVYQAVVIADSKDSTSCQLVAFIVTDRKKLESILLEDSLREELAETVRKELPTHMVPSQIVMIDEFPLTPNGKIDRRNLEKRAHEDRRRRRRDQSECSSPNDFVGATEQAILRIWKNTLEIESIGLDDNFFDLGGHSILAVMVHRDLKQELEDGLSITDFFRYPTIRTLAAHIDRISTDNNESTELQSVEAPVSVAKTRAQLRRERLSRKSTTESAK